MKNYRKVLLLLTAAMGAAGDMLLAALYELLDDQAGFLETMNTLLPDVRFAAVPASSCGVAGTHMLTPQTSSM